MLLSQIDFVAFLE